jgi:hypothetical protein
MWIVFFSEKLLGQSALWTTNDDGGGAELLYLSELIGFWTLSIVQY